MLASGSDDGTFAIRDLRLLKVCLVGISSLPLSIIFFCMLIIQLLHAKYTTFIYLTFAYVIYNECVLNYAIGVSFRFISDVHRPHVDNGKTDISSYSATHNREEIL